MNVIELQRALCGNYGLAAWPWCWKRGCVKGQADTMAPIDLISCLVADELTRRLLSNLSPF